MDEKTGDGIGRPTTLVRPVIYRPSEPGLPRKMPFNAQHMPMGVSANTINVASHLRAQRIRRLLFFSIPLTVLLAVVVAVWLAARSLAPLQPKVISNDIFDYHFMFYKTAEPVNLDQGSGLQDDNRSLVIAKPTTDYLYTDCSEVGKEWRRAFTALIQGKEQLVCTRDNKAYVVIFSHKEKRHLFEITYTSSQNGKTEELNRIFSSLEVTIR
jgi:hypothetical protein